MATFNLLLLILSLGVVLVAAWSICLARGTTNQSRSKIGRWIFTLSLLILGIIAIFAALTRADALAPLGVLSGLLVAGMLWESPDPSLDPGQ